MYYNALTYHVFSDHNQKILSENKQNNCDNTNNPFRVATFEQWMKLGKIVKRGEKSIKLHIITERGSRSVSSAISVFYESQTEEFKKGT